MRSQPTTAAEIELILKHLHDGCTKQNCCGVGLAALIADDDVISGALERMADEMLHHRVADEGFDGLPSAIRSITVTAFVDGMTIGYYIRHPEELPMKKERKKRKPKGETISGKA